MDVIVKPVLVDFIIVMFEEGGSDIVQGVKKGEVAKFEARNNCSGGCGTYRVNTSSKYILYFKELNGPVKNLNITSFLKKSFNVQRIMPKRRHVILNTKPISKQLMFDKILEDDSVKYQINENDERVIDWVKQMKNLL